MLDEWICFLSYEEIKESFIEKGLKEAQEKLSIMKPPEDDLHYQANKFVSS